LLGQKSFAKNLLTKNPQVSLSERMMQFKRRFLSGIVLFVLFGSYLVVLVNAEPSWVMWSQTYGEENFDVARALVETSDGGYALAGITRPPGAGLDDIWLVKTDANGNMEWNQTYGGESVEIAPSLVETSDGGYAIAGGTLSFGLSDYDCWLVKTDANGNMEWNQTYGGEHFDSAYALVETSDGGYALAGQTSSFGTGSNDFWLVRTNEQGIPEFPSWIIMPLLFVTTLMVIICKKRLPKNPSNI